MRYPVKGLHNKSLDMEHEQANLLHNQFRKATSAAMLSLDSEEGLVDREGSEDLVGQEESGRALWTYQRREWVNNMYMLQHVLRGGVGKGSYAGILSS